MLFDKSVCLILLYKNGCEPTYEELKLYRMLLFLKFPAQLRAYLWGIETQNRSNKRLQVSVLRAYLWGIETRKHLRGEHQERMLRAYLWGIETELNILHMKMPPTCEPTYEELKPEKARRVKMNPNKLRAYLWVIETMKTIDGIGEGCFVASLPMRNWNKGEKTRYCLTSALRAYLWGIETKIKRRRS